MSHFNSRIATLALAAALTAGPAVALRAVIEPVHRRSEDGRELREPVWERRRQPEQWKMERRKAVARPPTIQTTLSSSRSKSKRRWEETIRVPAAAERKLRDVAARVGLRIYKVRLNRSIKSPGIRELETERR